MECDVAKDNHIAVCSTKRARNSAVASPLHSVAFAPKDALEGDFVNTSREAFAWRTT